MCCFSVIKKVNRNHDLFLDICMKKICQLTIGTVLPMVNWRMSNSSKSTHVTLTRARLEPGHFLDAWRSHDKGALETKAFLTFRTVSKLHEVH